MGRDILDAFAVDPDLASIAKALKVFGAGVGTRARRHDVPSNSLAFFCQSAEKRKTFSFGGCGEKVSSHRTGFWLVLTNVCTHPTPVHNTSPACARYHCPSSVPSTSPLRMKYASSNV